MNHEFEDSTPVDPSRTFGPSPQRRVDPVNAATWAFVLAACFAVVCTIVIAGLKVLA